jgi:hypothetical protein
MYYGLHEWTAALTGGVVDARFIAVVDTALESPLGQVAMIPMLAWIANSAPANLKATFFAVMASFTNLALSASQLGTKYLNQVFTSRARSRTAPPVVISVPADYSELGWLMITAMLLGLLLPLAAVALIRRYSKIQPSVARSQLTSSSGLNQRRDLAGAVLRGVGAVGQVAADVHAEVVADGARRGLGRLGGAQGLAHGGDGVLALPGHGQHRRAGDVVDQARVEGLVLELGVVLGGQFLRHAHELGAHQLQAAALQAGDDLTDQAALHAVGFHHDEGLFHCRLLIRMVASLGCGEWISGSRAEKARGRRG